MMLIIHAMQTTDIESRLRHGIGVWKERWDLWREDSWKTKILPYVKNRIGHHVGICYV